MTRKKHVHSDPVDGGSGQGPDELGGVGGAASASPQVDEASPEPAEQARIEQALLAEREKYLRLAAEFDNFRKRTAKERLESGYRAQGEVISGLIEVMDDIMRFAHLDPATVDSAMVVQGVALVERKIFKSLGGHGLEVVNPVGQLFDPAFHEAVSTEPAETEAEDHLIARVFQAGYVFRGQLLRPARVVVRQWLG